MDPYKDRIRPLFEESGLTDKDLEQELGLPRGVIYKWGTGDYKSYKTYYPVIAKRFNVSIDYLLGLTDERNSENKPAIREESELTLEEQVMQAFRGLTPEKKREVLARIEDELRKDGSIQEQAGP